MVKIVVITANHWRHHYLVNRLIGHFDVLGVVSETKRPLQSGRNPEEDKIIKAYDREWEEKERAYFGNETEFRLAENKILRVDYQSASGKGAFEWIKKLTPQYLILFSSSVIKDPLLALYHGRLINMHLGLAPYYRGSAATFWPLVMGEPECVGATVHLVVKQVDAGSVLGQSRPRLVPGDSHRDVSNKNVISGTDLLSRCITLYASGKIAPQRQDLSVGRVFKHDEFSAEAIMKMRENFSSGMIENYLKYKGERDRKFPIVEA